MATPATGELRPLASGWEARIRVDDAGTRKGFALLAIPKSDEPAARARCAEMSELAVRLRRAGHDADDVIALLAKAAKTRAGKPWEQILGAVNALCAGAAPKVGDAAPVAVPTVKDFAADWTSGRLHKKYPDHVAKKDSTRDEEVFRLYINPMIGDVPINRVTLDHAEQVMANVPSTKAPRTRKGIAQCMRRILSLAVYPGRYLTANPIQREWMPKIPKSANKAKACLYPAEDAKLVACREIPIERRLVYGILAREGMRASELARLRWRDLDLEHGRIRLDKNKTSDPRAWALDPSVARALAWWKKTTGGEADDLVIGIDLHLGAWWLHGDLDGDDPRWSGKARPGDLRTAGITRPELFERNAGRQPIRMHDLRATFVTLSLANGKTEQWVTDRTGHKSSAMVALYSRQARTWAELKLGELAPLDELLPEMGGASTDSGGVECPTERPIKRQAPVAQWIEQRFPNGTGEKAITAPRENSGERDPSEAEIDRHGALMGHSTGQSDDVAELAKRLAAKLRLVESHATGDVRTLVTEAREQAERLVELSGRTAEVIPLRR